MKRKQQQQVERRTIKCEGPDCGKRFELPAVVRQWPRFCCPACRQRYFYHKYKSEHGGRYQDKYRNN